MKLSGFTMVKNAGKLYYPIKQVIMSILPVVDEFVVALGDCDDDDTTRSQIESIKSDKVKIIDTVWDLNKYPRGMENAHQTDIAKQHCSGDWLFYLQADEVVHEKYLPAIKEACEKYLDDKAVEGFVFKYLHFWGDYDHYHNSHGWYKHEVRIIRKHKDIHSWQSAQSFRRIPNFDGLNYRQVKGTYMLKCVIMDACIYHYGWVRPPHLMKSKSKALDTIHKGTEKVEEMYSKRPAEFDYGPLGILPRFKGTHPRVMQEWIAQFNWGDKLNYSKKRKNNLARHKHEKPKYRIFTFIKQKIPGGSRIGDFENFIEVKK